MKTLLLALTTLVASQASAAFTCSAFLHGRGHSTAKIYSLVPMKQDETLLSVKVGDYSFVVDTLEYKKNGNLVLFIHDLEADYTAVSNGQMKKIGSSGREARLQAIIGYDSADPMTLSVSCYD